MGSWITDSPESLIKFNIPNIDLEVNPASEVIFDKLVTDVKRGPFINLMEIMPLVKCNRREYFERILLLDE